MIYNTQTFLKAIQEGRVNDADACLFFLGELPHVPLDALLNFFDQTQEIKNRAWPPDERMEEEIYLARLKVGLSILNGQHHEFNEDDLPNLRLLVSDLLTKWKREPHCNGMGHYTEMPLAEQTISSLFVERGFELLKQQQIDFSDLFDVETGQKILNSYASEGYWQSFGVCVLEGVFDAFLKNNIGVAQYMLDMEGPNEKKPEGVFKVTHVLDHKKLRDRMVKLDVITYQHLSDIDYNLFDVTMDETGETTKKLMLQGMKLPRTTEGLDNSLEEKLDVTKLMLFEKRTKQYSLKQISCWAQMDPEGFTLPLIENGEGHCRLIDFLTMKTDNTFDPKLIHITYPSDFDPLILGNRHRFLEQTTTALIELQPLAERLLMEKEVLQDKSAPNIKRHKKI